MVPYAELYIDILKCFFLSSKLHLELDFFTFLIRLLWVQFICTDTDISGANLIVVHLWCKFNNSIVCVAPRQNITSTGRIFVAMVDMC